MSDVQFCQPQQPANDVLEPAVNRQEQPGTNLSHTEMQSSHQQQITDLLEAEIRPNQVEQPGMQSVETHHDDSGQNASQHLDLSVKTFYGTSSRGRCLKRCKREYSPPPQVAKTRKNM
jgi:hypothetical protein